VSLNLRSAAALFALLSAGSRFTFAEVIGFENQCPGGVQVSGPCSTLFSTVGNAQTVTTSTSIGMVTVTGGAIFDQITNLPADETAVYGTAGNAANIGVFPGSGFTNPLTITFPSPIHNVFLDVLNGNTINVDYQVADNAGNSADFFLIPNLSGGQKTIGLAATGNVITITAKTGQLASGGMTWDYLIDNIHFNEGVGQSGVPEPATYMSLGAGLVVVGVLTRRKRCANK
jgi:hypothetical protein